MEKQDEQRESRSEWLTSIASPAATRSNPGEYQTENGFGKTRNETRTVRNLRREVMMTRINGPKRRRTDKTTYSPQQEPETVIWSKMQDARQRNKREKEKQQINRQTKKDSCRERQKKTKQETHQNPEVNANVAESDSGDPFSSDS